MTNTITSTRRTACNVNGRRFLLVTRPDNSLACFMRVGSKWSGGAVTAEDRQAVANVVGVDPASIV